MAHIVRRVVLAVGLTAVTLMGTVGHAGAASDETIRSDSIKRLYLAYFIRQPDNAGFLYWLAQCQKGVSLGLISASFAGSPEFKARYGTPVTADFIRLVYRNVLQRDPDPEGFAFWTKQIDGRIATRGQMMVNFAQSAEFIAATNTSIPPIVDVCGGKPLPFPGVTPVGP